jgi:hypothetical protein
MIVGYLEAVFSKQGATVTISNQLHGGEAGSHVASQESHIFYGHLRFMVVFTKPATCPYPEPDESSPNLPTQFL